MPTWMMKVLAEIEPMTAVEPAAIALGTAIGKELLSADSYADKAIEIGRLLVQYAPQIEAAMNANVPPTAA